MIAPNKVVTLRESALGLVPLILSEGPYDITLPQLRERIGGHHVELEQFMLAMDILYVLGRTTLDFENGVVSYAD